MPAVDELLRGEAMQAIVAREGHTATVEHSRAHLNELRARIASGEMTEDQVAAAVEAAPREIERRLTAAMAYSLRPVINATGVILHTNLGRAPLSGEAMRHAVEVAQGYSNIEMDLETGERGKRDVHVSRLFARLLKGPALPPKEGGRTGHPREDESHISQQQGNVGHPTESHISQNQGYVGHPERKIAGRRRPSGL